MRTIDIYTRGKSIFQHIKSDLDKFIRGTGLDIQLNEISDVHAISAQNPKAIPYLKMVGAEPIHMEQGEYIHAFCSRVRRWMVDAVGSGSMRQVLVPIDFSEPSLNALAYAMNRYKGSYTVIKIISAHMEVVGSINDVPVLDTYTLGHLNNKMNKLIDGLISDEEHRNLILKGEIITGPIVPSILKEAEKEENTIIYIGSSGSNTLMKNLFGSVTRQLAKKTKVPLFIIPPNYSKPVMTKIGFAVSDPQKDGPLFKKLYELVGDYNPTLHLIHSQDETEYFNYDDYKDLTADFQAHLVKSLLLSEREVVKNITKYINNGNFHLLVMSHYQRPMLESLFHKSITKQVVSGIKCPVLILNSDPENPTLDQAEKKKDAKDLLSIEPPEGFQYL